MKKRLMIVISLLSLIGVSGVLKMAAHKDKNDNIVNKKEVENPYKSKYKAKEPAKSDKTDASSSDTRQIKSPKISESSGIIASSTSEPDVVPKESVGTSSNSSSKPEAVEPIDKADGDKLIEENGYKEIATQWTNVTGNKSYDFSDDGLKKDSLALKEPYTNIDGTVSIDVYVVNGAGGFTILYVPVGADIPDSYFANGLTDTSDNSKDRLLIGQNLVYGNETLFNDALFYKK